MKTGTRALSASLFIGAGLLTINVSKVRAEPILSESGTIAGFTLTTSGGVGSTVSIDLFGPSATTRRNNIPEPIPIPTVFSMHLELLITSIVMDGPATLFGFTQVSGPAFKDVFPFTGGQASFSYLFNMGTSVQQTSHELNLAGLLALFSNTSSDDYLPFTRGGEHNLTMTDPNHDLGAILQLGGSADGSAAFSERGLGEVAFSQHFLRGITFSQHFLREVTFSERALGGVIPEPASIVLLAMGLPLVGGYVLRRRVKKGE